MKVFISAFQSENNETVNVESTVELKQYLLDHFEYITQCFGVYKGESESSFMIDIDTNEQLNKLKGLAWGYNQECILVVEDDRESRLVYPCHEVNIGKFTEISSYLASKSNSFTYIPSFNQYYVCA